MRIALLARRKNDYGIGPKITDGLGMVTFDHGEMEKSIASNQKHFPMDYTGTLEDCVGIQVEVLGRDEVRSLIEARDMWGAVIPECQLTAALRCELLRAEERIMSGAKKVISGPKPDSLVVLELNVS